MSYILDALKRADAERGRGSVPGLHTQQVTRTEPSPPATFLRTFRLAVTMALASIVIGIGIWWAWHPVGSLPLKDAPEPPMAKVAPPAPPSSSPASSSQAVARSAAPEPALPQPLSAPALAPAAEPVVPPAEIPAPARSAQAPASDAPAPAKRSPRPAAVAERSASRTEAAPIPSLAELPEELRRQIPALAISGALYSDTAADRALVVNQQVLQEGSQVAPNLRLEQIGADSSVFNFRGTRFRLSH